MNSFLNWVRRKAHDVNFFLLTALLRRSLFYFSCKLYFFFGTIKSQLVQIDYRRASVKFFDRLYPPPANHYFHIRCVYPAYLSLFRTSTCTFLFSFNFTASSCSFRATASARAVSMLIARSLNSCAKF